MSKKRLKWVLVFLTVAALLSLLSDSIRGKLERRARYALWIVENTWLRKPVPNVAWQEASPEQVGMSGQALDAMRESLERRGTSSFLVARRGKLVYEWYRVYKHPNFRFPLAAAAKPIIGTWLLLLEASDGSVDLDDRASRYIEAWANDPQRSKITLRQLASHTSGLDDVTFDTGEGHAEEWKTQYEENRDVRFEMAIHRLPMLLEPGERQLYSGAAYYALAYALMKARSRTDDASHERYLADRLMEPLGIPDAAWELSYGESYVRDGMVLQAIGSGASLTARAVARIATLMLSEGKWQGRQLVEARWFPELVRRSARIPHDETLGRGGPSAGMGWYLNGNGFYPSLPRDAILAIGRKHQIVLVIPSLELIVVRTGGQYLGAGDETFHQDLEEQLNVPLMRSLVGPHG